MSAAYRGITRQDAVRIARLGPTENEAIGNLGAAGEGYDIVAGTLATTYLMERLCWEATAVFTPSVANRSFPR